MKNKNYLLRRILVHSLQINDNALGHAQISQIHSCGDNVEHTSSENSDLSVRADSVVDYLLYSVDI